MNDVKYKVERSKFPERNKTHLVFRYSVSSHGYNIKRVFKGTYKECIEKARELNRIDIKEIRGNKI